MDRFIESGDRKQTVSYYTVTPGFTVEEVYSYLEDLRKGRDPRPFSRYSPRLEIPFVNYRRYSLHEVTDGMNLMKEDGLIRVREGLFPGETRYDLSNESLKNLARDVWFINIFDFNLLLGRLLFKGKPPESDKNYLTLYMGERLLMG